MPTFTKVMASLGELYGKSVSEILVDLYWNALKRFDIHAIRQAVHTHINNPDRGQFMPKWCGKSARHVVWGSAIKNSFINAPFWVFF
jgi:hypothetical protein